NSPPLIQAPTRGQQGQLDALRRRLADLEQQARAREPEVASAQAAWESSIRHRPAFDWRSDGHLVVHLGCDGGLGGSCSVATTPKACSRDGRARFTAGPVGSAIVLDGRGYLDAGDRAAFGFYDKFTLSAWIRPSGPHGGTILSRMVDQPQAEGYSVVLDRGKV